MEEKALLEKIHSIEIRQGVMENDVKNIQDQLSEQKR